MRNKEHKKMDDKKIEKVLSNAAASMAVEGLIVKSEEIEVMRKHLRGQLAEKEILEIINNNGKS